MKTLIISDIHLGSDLTRVKDLLDVLSSIVFDRLIILGDLFDHIKLYKLNMDDWELIDFIKGISIRKEIIWVEGNHDEQLFNVVPLLLGIKARKQFEWFHSGKKFIAIHGHQFDHYYNRKSYLSRLGGRVFRYLLKLENKTGTVFINEMSHKNKSWMKLAEDVALRAIEYGQRLKADYVICGHTHKAIKLLSNYVVYVNTGSWHDRVCHFVTINDTELKLNAFIE